MTASAKLQLLVLFEDEIRKAAALLTRAGEASDEDWSACVRDAIEACAIALHGADNEDMTLILTSRDRTLGSCRKAVRQRSNPPAASDVASTPPDAE